MLAVDDFSNHESRGQFVRSISMGLAGQSSGKVLGQGQVQRADIVYQI